MRRKAKRGAAFVLSMMLALGSVNAPLYAQEQTEATTQMDAGTSLPFEEQEAESVIDEVEETVVETESDVIIQEEKERAEKVCMLSFVNAETGEMIGDEYVDIDAGAQYGDGIFLFNEDDIGKVISYRINIDGYVTVKDSVILDEGEQTVEIELKKKAAPAEGTVSIEKVYGEEPFSVYDYLDIDKEYDGELSFELTDGLDVIEEVGNGTYKLIGVGEALVNIRFPETGTHAEAEVQASITVSRCRIGDIFASDIDWDATEKTFDGSDEIELMGTVKEHVGIRNGDVIRVWAKAKTDSPAVGTRQSRIIDYYFEGSENYDITLFEAGPQVTIGAREADKDTGKKVLKNTLKAAGTNVRLRYDDNNPVNDMYFNHDRTMTAEITDSEFDENLLSLHIGINEEEGDYTLAQIRAGEAGSVALSEDIEGEGETKTFSILFGGQQEEVENRYTFTLTYDGKEADTDGCVAAGEFVVDEISPVLSVTFADADGAEVLPGATEETPAYVVKPVTATLAVTDGSFDPSGTDINISARNAEGKENGAYPEASEKAPAESEWESDEKTHVYKMEPFEKDARYSFTAAFTDMAGNSAEGFGPGYITIDTTAPTGEVVVTTADGKKKEYSRVLEEKELKEGIFQHVFGLFSRKVTLENTAADEASGIASVQYYLQDVENNAGAAFVQQAELESLEWQDWKEGIKIDTDRILVVYEKITDKAGHTTYISSGGGIIVDTKEPGTPEILIEATSSTSYKADFEVKISATDPDNGGDGIFSGMKTISYKVVNELTGEVTLEGEKKAAEPRTRDLEEEITIPVSGNNSNAVKLTVIAEDYAGNSSTKEQTFSCDSTAPVITIDFDDSGVSNGHYFNTTREVKVTFEERNYRPERSKLMVKTSGEEISLSMEQLMKGQGAAYGISVKEMSDTQNDLLWIKRTDAREVTYTLLIGDGQGIDRDYSSLRFTSEDDAGNRSEEAETKYSVFTVDKVAPVLAVAYSIGSTDVTERIGTNKNAPYYTQGKITPEITVTEHNFWANGVTAQVTQKDSDGNDIEAYTSDSIEAVHEKAWNRSGNTSSFAMDAFTDDANYGLSIRVTDMAGNSASEYPEHYFTIDNTPPTGKLIVTSGDGTGEYTGFSGSVKFIYMDNESVAVTNEAEDKTSGVASVSYYRYVPPIYARGTFAGLTLDNLRNVNWTGWNEGLSIEPDSQAVIYARIIDRAGNVTYINTEGGIIADKTSPDAPEISLNIATPAGGIFNRDVPVSVNVEDIVSGGTFSGLRNVTIEVLRDGSVTQSSSVDFGPKEDRRMGYAADITVDAESNNSNNVLVRVTAEDYAGNISGMERNLKIDITAPRIEVTYDYNDPVNGRYYNRQRTATVTVYERNFDPSGVNFFITGSPRISGWSGGGQDGESDDNANTCTIVYEDDAEYSFSMSVTDIAGNSADYGRTDSFVVDQTEPAISVAFDNNAVSNGRYYNRPRTAYITVTDLSFDADLFEAAVRASLDGEGISAPQIEGWTHSGLSHTAMLTFTSDGDYDFILNCTDLADNKAQAYTQETFTVDMTRPMITFFDVENGSANSGEVAPGIRYEDLNIGENKIRLILKGYRHKEKEVTGILEQLEHGGTIKLEDIAHLITEDDVYTLTASVTDLAGNTTTETLVFSVNRFGSNYYFSDMTADYLAKHYNKDGSNIVIYEVNVNSLHDNAVTIYHDGKVITVPAGRVKMEDISEQDDWKRYRYSLDASLFKEEGTYEILVSSIDEAGNRQDNKLKDVPISFVVDKTAPSAVITGVENGGYYDEKNREAGITVTDNIAMGSLKVYVNDTETASYTAEQIAQAEGKLSVTLSESEEWQTISLKFEDAAGNMGTADRCRVLVSTNAVTRILHSRLWLWILLLVLAGGGTYAVVKRKKAAN